MGVTRHLVLVVAALAVACSHPAENATPEGAVRAWLEHMEDSLGDPAEERRRVRLHPARGFAGAHHDAAGARPAQLDPYGVGQRRDRPRVLLGECRLDPIERGGDA